ncbi:PKD repeat protein [Streptacidiphilus sp. MAP12-16]|uniref:PKD domain-containing protein n=1 Tax=Streptacidiphilus sp. MAP12-16 TaxID=3156300 RepID=UPI0035149E1B
MPSRSTAVAVALGVVAGMALVAVPTTTFADGSTLYVSNATAANCSDSAVAAGTAAQPYCSVQAAVDAAKPGDTVQVAYGHYQPVDIKTSGTASAPITITGPASGGLPSLMTQVGGSGPTLAFDHVHDVRVSGLFVWTNIDAPTVAVSGSTSVTVDRSRIWGGGTNTAVSPALTVDGQSSSFTLSRTQISDVSHTTGVAVASGATGTVLTTNQFDYLGQPAVTAVDAPGTVIVSNTFTDSDACNTAISLTGASSGATVENNAVTLGTGAGGCYYGTSTPVVVSVGSAVGTVYDYNTIQTASTGALYSWAGQSYATPTALQATGHGFHELSEVLTPGPTGVQMQALNIDSADVSAPGELSTDIIGRARVDDPLVGNTGTGVGYYDRGAAEYQDPYKVAPILSATKGPAPLTETVTATESNPWNTKIVSYTFRFGDGSDPVVSSSPTVSHTYTATGSYSAGITATSADGATFTGSGGVQVVAVAPLVPVLSVQHSSGQSSLTVQADGLGTTDDWSITGYSVDFGDETTPVAVAPGQNATHTYANPGAYTVKLTVKDDGGNTATTTKQLRVGSALVPFGPVRFLDTRTGTGAAKVKVGPGGVVRLKVAGVQGVPTTGVTAVTLNLTGVDATTATWVGAYPDGTPVPTASNLNLLPNQAVPNLVTVPVSADGYVDLYNRAGSVDLVADVEGYYSTAAPLGVSAAFSTGFVISEGPTRVLDTRDGTGTWTHKVGAGGSVSFPLPTSALPNATLAGISAVILNVTETNASDPSYVAVQQSSKVPTTSILNFSTGQTSSNQVLAPVDQYGNVTLYNRTGSVDLIADVQGYVVWDSASPKVAGSSYFPVNPSRVLDTRTGLGAAKAGALGSKSQLVVQIAGVKGIPAGVQSVLVNLTGIAPTADTWIGAFADGSALPNSSNLNLGKGTVRAGLALVPVGPDGSIDIYNSAGSVNIAADIEGYYTG